MYEKIIELVDQSKGWSSIEHSKDKAENMLIGVSEEELYGLPTAEYVGRRFNFLDRALTVYHAAFQALADLKNVKVPLHSGVLIYNLKMNIKVVIFMPYRHMDSKSPILLIFFSLMYCTR